MQSLCRAKKISMTRNVLPLHFAPARPAQAKFRMLTAICSIVKLLAWNEVNLSHLYRLPYYINLHLFNFLTSIWWLNSEKTFQDDKEVWKFWVLIKNLAALCSTPPFLSSFVFKRTVWVIELRSGNKGKYWALNYFCLILIQTGRNLYGSI